MVDLALIALTLTPDIAGINACGIALFYGIFRFLNKLLLSKYLLCMKQTIPIPRYRLFLLNSEKVMHVGTLLFG